ncbi:hypothetical protein UP06_16515 [Bradyrhizobium sp. LTSP857]|nr:hypothetical protein UP06_16515 [Bradyrhizobium sp. LTSP857]
MVFLPHAFMWQAGQRGRRSLPGVVVKCAFEPEANDLRMRLFPPAHKLAKSRRPPPRAVKAHARVASRDKPTQIAQLATLV